MNKVSPNTLERIKKDGTPTKAEFLQMADIAKNIPIPRTEGKFLAAVLGVSEEEIENGNIDMDKYSLACSAQCLLLNHDGDDLGEHAAIDCYDDDLNFEYYTIGENFDAIVASIANQLPA